MHTWVVMQAPTGQRFCVVRQQRKEQIATPVESELTSLVGHYESNGDTLFVEPVMGGRWLRMQWFGEDHIGELLLSPTQLTWIDTLYTHPDIVLCNGSFASYAGGDWRIEWQRDPLRMRIYKEQLVASIDWRRL